MYWIPLAMEISWFIIFVTLCTSFALKSLFGFIQYVKIKKPKLPPGPSIVSIFSKTRWLPRFSDLEPTLRQLRPKYGDIITLHVGNRKGIFITSHELAHRALIQQGAIFADRPPALAIGRFLSTNQHNVNSAAYGPLWRLLRRNLSSEILHPSQVKSFTEARKWVFEILKNKLKSESESGQKRPVLVKDHFQYAMFCLLVFMCFGEKFDENVVRQVEKVQRDLVINLSRFNVLNFLPISLSKILFRKRWSEILRLRGNQASVIIPLVRAREHKLLNNDRKKSENSLSLAYVDTLLNLNIPEDGGRKLNDNEMLSLISEFLTAGTDTTSTALQWIMANLVKNQEIQTKLYNEIKEVIINDDDYEGEIIKEEGLQKMRYLKAVVLEGLRRHPPAHFVAPHAVTEDTVFGGYLVPKDAIINFTVAEMGWDPRVWEDPMVFKPERFLCLNKGGTGVHQGEVLFDVTGSKEIKMMPFGAGRRICPGLGLAMLHLEYFVANLVKEFKWTAREGDEIDLSEKEELTVVMKYPLWAHISSRRN